MDERLKILCNLYDKSDESIDIYSLLKVCFINNLSQALNLLTHRQCVKFAYLCAKSVLHLNDENTKEKAEKYLELVEKWLENSYKISYKEIDIITNEINHIICFYNSQSSSNAIYSIKCAVSTIYDDSFYNSYTFFSYKNSIGAAKNEQRQRYKNLGFLVKVIRDES